MEEGVKTDILTTLPPELLHMIISYLFTTHQPDKAFSPCSLGGCFTRARGNQHPLDLLAGTCRTLRAEVMDWAETFLRQHRNITRYRGTKKTIKGKLPRNRLRGREGLITWSTRNCVFCGKTTQRTAIMMNGLNCCLACDKVQWPDKITKTAAREEYHLTDHHLLPHQHRTPISAKMLARHPGGMPKLTYGTYMSSNVPTTMFLRNEVEILAGLVHGDLKAHLAKRKADREERSRKIQQTKAKKIEDGNQTLAQPHMQYAAASSALLNAGSSATRPIVIPDSGWVGTDSPNMEPRSLSFQDDFLGMLRQDDWADSDIARL